MKGPVEEGAGRPGRTSRPTPTGPSAGQLLELIRSRTARTRGDLREITGLSRSTIAARINELTTGGFITESGVEVAARGRPSTVLSFDEHYGVVLAADLGATRGRLAICDLAGRVLESAPHDVRIEDGPETVLGRVESTWRELLAGRSPEDGPVVGVGIGVPGPVDAESGRPVRPPIMPGWDGYPIVEHLQDRFGVPGFVENDANMLALGEFHASLQSCPSLLSVKVATGIGAGMIINGHLVRGIHGGSGDIGHVRLTDPETGPTCSCGARGCLAASASGGAIARRLRDRGRSVRTTRDVVELVRENDPEAVTLIREAGAQLGGVLATAVSLLNPQVLMLGGDLVEPQEHLMVSLKETLYQRTQPLATRDLRVVTGTLGDAAGVVGATKLVVDGVFSAASVDRVLAGLGRER